MPSGSAKQIGGGQTEAYLFTDEFDENCHDKVDQFGADS